MIKAAKQVVSNILGNANITDEELHTAFTRAESLLNARPLTYLFGQVGRESAPESVKAEDYHPKKRWGQVQELVQHFWKRWIQEWLPFLSSRRK